MIKRLDLFGGLVLEGCKNHRSPLRSSGLLMVDDFCRQGSAQGCVLDSRDKSEHTAKTDQASQVANPLNPKNSMPNFSTRLHLRGILDSLARLGCTGTRHSKNN